MRDSDIDITLVYKKIEGRLTLEEDRQLEEWLQDRAHQEYFRNIREYYELHREPSTDAGQTEQAWLRMKKRLQRHNRFPRNNRFVTFMAAASIAALLAFPSLWYSKSSHTSETVAITEILPGNPSAILELADGRSVNLSRLTREERKQIDKHALADSTRLDYSRQSAEHPHELAYNKITVPRGGEFMLILEDSTKVWLNAESHLKYPVTFGQDKREIYLEGEAYFEVKKDSKRPFTVYAGAQKVTVSGTSFGITGYNSDQYATTTLVDGSVNVEFPGRSDKVYVLTPGHQIRYDHTKGEITQEIVNTAEYVAWKEGKYVFRKKRLEDMMTTLGRWYNFQAFYQDSQCKEILFSGDIRRFDDFNSILNLLRKSSDVDFTVNGNTVVVRTKC